MGRKVPVVDGARANLVAPSHESDIKMSWDKRGGFYEDDALAKVQPEEEVALLLGGVFGMDCGAARINIELLFKNFGGRDGIRLKLEAYAA